jgi:hypothetical protein
MEQSVIVESGLKLKIKRFLKQFPELVRLKRNIWRIFDSSVGRSKLDILFSFPLYIPSTGGTYKERSALTIQTINQVFPFLSSLSTSVSNKKIEISDIRGFPKSVDDFRALDDLKILFDKYGSDKSNHHNYHNIYGPILKNRNEIRAVFEVGLGTNNTDVVSNMGTRGKPGASLRAFRDFLPNASIFGADIDKRVLFSEERISTFHVDQTEPSSFVEFQKSLPERFDLIIDDGLHSPNANIQTLNFGLSKIKAGGWVVIEDIGGNAIPLWEVVSAVLPSQYESYLFDAEGGTVVFAVKKIN